jgi:hypothetical protein
MNIVGHRGREDLIKVKWWILNNPRAIEGCGCFAEVLV